VDKIFKKKAIPQNAMPEAERRRIAKVVHDDRGNASVRWRNAPANYQRPVLKILGDAELTLASDETYDPYARAKPRTDSGNGRRTDLRKLSEWIKQMRELEAARKSNGGGEE
jgi:hypothetical protein